MARFVTAGITESPERAVAALSAAFDFVAATIDALTPSELDPALFRIRAAQPLRESEFSKKAAMEVLANVSSSDPDFSVGLIAAFWMQKISDALTDLDPQRIRKCPVCQDRLFYVSRTDQKACSPKHARRLRSNRWLRTETGKKYYTKLLKHPRKSRLLRGPKPGKRKKQ